MIKNVSIEGPDSDGEYFIKCQAFDDQDNLIILPAEGLKFLSFWNGLNDQEKKYFTLYFSKFVIDDYVEKNK
jgi:hypothetical protein